MARAALGWSIVELSNQSEVGVSTILRFETGKRQPNPSTLAALKRAFEAAGAEFIEDHGVSIRKPAP